MKEPLILSACNFLIPEISHVLRNDNYSDVQLISFKANCKENSINQNVIPILKIGDYSQYDNVVIGSYCYSQKLIDQTSLENLKVIKLQNCFDLFLNLDTINHFLNQGNYIVTNGWLKNLNKHIKEWGFDQQSARSFFQESLKSILLLDTKIPGDYLPNLKKLSDYTGLPYSILPVGLSYCTQRIDNIILNWRRLKEKKEMGNKLSKITKQIADHQIIIDQLESIVRLSNEAEIVQIAFQIINLLFSPSKIIYVNYNNEVINFEGFYNDTLICPENSFTIEINNSNEFLGIFDVSGVQFPQYINKYKEMAILISQIFGMAIANARKFSELEKSKALISENENKLKLSTVQLQELNSTKDRFFSIIAHDLKGPIGNFKIFIEMLLEDYDYLTETEKKEFLVALKDSSSNIFKLLENLLVWANSQKGNLSFKASKIHLSFLVNSIFDLLKLAAETKKITLKNYINKEILIVADENLIRTIIRNLLSNAIKFTNVNGIVEIGLNIDYKDKKMIVFVKDNGIGMDEIKLSQLFKIDSNNSSLGTNKEKGTGLGLIVCKELVEFHGGKIWADSEEGRGSVFYFDIPLTS